ncbi:MAG: hypothetical protein ACK4F7_10800, partial [Inhella sp.]
IGGDAAVQAAGFARDALGLDLLPAPVKEAQVDLLWLVRANAGGAKSAFTAHVHCLCTSP